MQDEEVHERGGHVEERGELGRCRRWGVMKGRVDRETKCKRRCVVKLLSLSVPLPSLPFLSFPPSSLPPFFSFSLALFALCVCVCFVVSKIGVRDRQSAWQG